MNRAARPLVGLVLLVALAGCSPSRETKDLVSTAAAVADGNLREWRSLTDEQKIVAHRKLTRALHVIDADVNGVELGPEWANREPPK